MTFISSFFDLDETSLTQSNSNTNGDLHETSDMTTKSSSSMQNSMVVSINGGFEIQNEDDYIAKGETRFPNGQKKNLVGSARGPFVPAPPTEAKQQPDPSKPQRPYPSGTRPKSSDASRTNYSYNGTSASWSGDRNRSAMNNSQRPKRYERRLNLYGEVFVLTSSAGVSQSVRAYLKE